ncbi:FLX1 [Candida pseudojiufengensis]|uniref:FLX1 n=1 Tax=Candida pseudojiufengensis TaxID=497109 RepID=UPI0022245CA3|nr:FLX1 [Candida pseudojiufengensis]KAI5959731.1 FLX1 [Candida pseudojiufengensis]
MGEIRHHRKQKFTSRQIETLSGLAAGFTTTIVTHPLDVLKIRLQLNHNKLELRSKPFQSVIEIIRQLNKDARSSTYLNLKHQRCKTPFPMNYLAQYYRGLTPNLIGNISAWGLYFSLYAEFKKNLNLRNQSINYFLSSTLAGISTSILTNPIWVLKTRILSSSKTTENAYKSTIDGIKQMLNQEGILSFWKGCIPSMFQVFQASLQITIYDNLKNYIVSKKDKNLHSNHHELHMLTTWQYLYTSAVSKIISTLIFYPTQVVKSRLQNYRSTIEISKKISISSVIKDLYFKEGGISAFYKGLSANILRVLPATCITFVVYENVKKWLIEL